MRSLAARTASPEAVGQASAAVSAMTLIGTIGMFGMGTMLISDLPKLVGRKWELISTCLLVSGGFSRFAEPVCGARTWAV